MKLYKNLKIILWLSFTGLLLSSCATNSEHLVRKAEKFTNDSNTLYEKAIEEYKQALLKTTDTQQIYKKLTLLYYHHGDFNLAIDILKNLSDIESQKLLALCFYKTGDYTSSLTIFNKIGEIPDDEYLYYYGLTCEKHNLYDQAKKIYTQIKIKRDFIDLSKKRLQEIDSFVNSAKISQLDPELSNLINSINAEDYPQAGAAILLASEEIEVLSDNTKVSQAHVLIKILNERGKKFGEVDIDYDSTFEKVELEYARTIKPDGEVIEVGSKHIRDVSRYLNFPLYSNARALIISMPEITVGSTIEYKIKITRSQLVDKKEFYSGYLLQNDEPLIYGKFIVTLPKDRKLNLKFVNEEYNYFSAELQPKIIQQGDKKIYSWEFRDIPQIIPEPLMPPISEINTTILLSTFPSWDKIYKWWWKLAQDKIEVDKAMKEKVSELTKDLNTPKEKARAIYNWCIQNIRYVAIEYGQAGYEPHKAIDIFTNKYGDCKDQAILLISLFQEAGINSYPVLIGTKENFKLIEDFPTLLFNHAIVALKIDGEFVFLDPTAETVPFGDLPVGDQGRKVLVFLEDRAQIQETPDFNPEHNRAKSSTTFKINSDETVLAERIILTEGFYDHGQRYHLRYTQPIIFEEDLKEKVHSFTPGGKLLDYHIENLNDMDKPIKLIYHFSGPLLFTQAGRARVIPEMGGVDLSIVAKDERLYPIDFSVLSKEETLITFELPKNLKVKFLPRKIEYNTKWLSIANYYSLDNSRLIFKEVHITKERYISPEDYKLFKASLEELSQKSKQCIVLEKIDF